MKLYNRIMELFWLAVGIIIIIMVTVMCLKESFSSWAVIMLLHSWLWELIS